MPVTTMVRADRQVNGFSRDDKAAFVSHLLQHGYRPLKACQVLGIPWSTYYRHYHADVGFRESVNMSKVILGERIRETSLTLAERTSEKTFPDRQLQLKALLPEYRNLDRSTVNVQVNTVTWGDGQAL